MADFISEIGKKTKIQQGVHFQMKILLKCILIQRLQDYLLKLPIQKESSEEH